MQPEGAPGARLEARGRWPSSMPGPPGHGAAGTWNSWLAGASEGALTEKAEGYRDLIVRS